MHALAGARIGRARTDAVFRPHRRNDRDLVAHIVEDGGDRRPQEDRVGKLQRIGRRRSETLDGAHEVVTQIAEKADRHRRQMRRQGHLRRAEQQPQRLERPRRFFCRLERIRRAARAAVDLGFAVAAAPDQIGLEADDGIASARLAALHALEQERVVAAFGEFEIGGNRRVEIGYAPRIDRLGAALVIGAGERREVRFDGHRSLTILRRPTRDRLAPG